MKMIQTHCLLVILMVLFVALDAGAQLYRWVDKDGRVQYTDTPPPPDAKGTQQLRLNTAPGAPAPSSTSIAEQEKAFQKRRADAAKAETKAEADAKAAAENAQACAAARSHLATLNDGGRIARTKANGEREILDDAAIEAEKVKARASVAEACKAS
jgi:regulator of protease activity HflC (stomatin/prohibitin superfamily)